MRSDLLDESVYNCIGHIVPIRDREREVIPESELQVLDLIQTLFIEGLAPGQDLSFCQERIEFKEKWQVVENNYHKLKEYSEEEFNDLLTGCLYRILNKWQPSKYANKQIPKDKVPYQILYLLAILDTSESIDDFLKDRIKKFLNSFQSQNIFKKCSYRPGDITQESQLILTTRPRNIILYPNPKQQKTKTQQLASKLSGYNSAEQTINPTLLKSNDLETSLTHFRFHNSPFQPDWNIHRERDAQQAIYDYLTSGMVDKNTACFKSDLKQKIQYFFTGDTFNFNYLASGGKKLLNYLVIAPSPTTVNYSDKFLEINEMIDTHLVVDVLLKIAQLTRDNIYLFKELQEHLHRRFALVQFEKQRSIPWLLKFFETLNVALCFDSTIVIS